MVPLFLGLNAANLLVLSTVFLLGLLATGPASTPTALYSHHVMLGLFAGLLAVLAHVATLTYFMATTKWLAAACDKQDMNPNRFVAPAATRKRRVLLLCMAAVVVTMLAMFAGAGADPTVDPWWPAGVHLLTASVAVATNLFAAVGQYRLVKAQGGLMDEALEILNRDEAAPVGPAAVGTLLETPRNGTPNPGR